MILNETYTLSNGIRIPKLGLGTWFIPDGEAAEAVRTAVSMGYRHVDTAQAYENEAGVGEGVRTCGAPGTDIRHQQGGRGAQGLRFRRPLH